MFLLLQDEHSETILASSFLKVFNIFSKTVNGKDYIHEHLIE